MFSNFVMNLVLESQKNFGLKLGGADTGASRMKFSRVITGLSL
jgi:hypothetical protein